jgi:hypothetical protein
MARPLTRGPRPSFKVEFTWADIQYDVSGIEALDVHEQTIFYVLIALAARKNFGGELGDTFGAQSKDVNQKELWDGFEMDPKSIAARKDAIRFVTTLYEISKECGFNPRAGNRSSLFYRRMRDSLKRISKITLDIEDLRDKTMRSAGRLISYSVDDDGNTVIGINPLIAMPLLEQAQYFYMDLGERLSLKGDVAKLTHSRLSTLLTVRNGQLTKNLDEIAHEVWCTDPKDRKKVNPSTLRDRRDAVKEALKEIAFLHGWKVEYDDSNGEGRYLMVKISRDRKKGNV